MPFGDVWLNPVTFHTFPYQGKIYRNRKHLSFDEDFCYSKESDIQAKQLS